MNNVPVIIGIATIQERRESLKETMESLEGQADGLFIYSNDYSFGKYKYNGKNFRASGFGDGFDDLGDVGKFDRFILQAAYSNDAYCIVCDDDLIYPPDFVERIIEAIEDTERAAVVGFHGKEYYGPVGSYYQSLGPAVERNDARNHRCLDEVRAPRMSKYWPVTVIGTGCTGWHSSLFKDSPLTMDDFPHKNMADILFSKKCNDLGIPRLVIPHEEGYIKHSDKFDQTATIFNRYYGADEVQTAVFNSVEWEI